MAVFWEDDGCEVEDVFWECEDGACCPASLIQMSIDPTASSEIQM